MAGQAFRQGLVQVSLGDFYTMLMTGLAQVAGQRSIWPNVCLKDLEVDCGGEHVWIDKDFPGDLVLQNCHFANARDRIAIGNSSTRNAIRLHGLTVQWVADTGSRILDASYCRAGTWFEVESVSGFSMIDLNGARVAQSLMLANIRDAPVVDVSGSNIGQSLSVGGDSLLEALVAESCAASTFLVETSSRFSATSGACISLLDARIGQLGLHAESFRGASGNPAVDLRNARVGSVAFESARELPVPLKLGNADIAHWEWRDDGGSDAAWIAELLEKDAGIPAGVYLAAEQALRTSGQDDEADDLHRRYRKRASRAAHWARRPLMWLWGATTGYGTQPARPIAIWVAAFVVVVGTLYATHSAGVQPDPAYLASVTECGRPCAGNMVLAPGDTSRARLGDAFLLGTDAGLPFFGLDASPGIAVTPGSLGHWISLVYSLLSWVLLPAAAGALAGRLLRPGR